MTFSDEWGTDTTVSMPEPKELEIDAPTVDLGGFMMTEDGIAHNLTSSDLEIVYTPRYAPLPQLKVKDHG